MINAKIKHKIESGEIKAQISSKDKFNNCKYRLYS